MMIRFFRNLRLDSISFWAGFVASTLLWLLLRILRPALRKGWEFLKTTVQSARQGLLTNTEQRHRVDTIKHVQGLHLAAPLFSLDEVLITPRLMAPPVIVDPDLPPPYEDTVSTTIPFTPDWPELAAIYATNSLDVFDVLSGSSNIAIIGKPGIGKTTILAYIATKIARQDPEAEAFQNTLPVFLHVEELEFPEDAETEVLDAVIKAVSARASTLTLPRLSELLQTSFELGKVILLLDGLDELAPEAMRVRVEYLGELIESYPDNQIVVAADVHQIDGLPALGFATIPVAPWGKINQAKFIQRWGNLWSQFIIPDPDPEEYIDPLLLNGWLINLDPISTPFDITLKVWAAYAGDSRGPSDIDAIEAYIQRLYVDLPKARITLELIASETLQIMETGFTENQALDWIRKGGVEEIITETEEIVPEEPDTEIEPIKKNIIFRILPELIQQGLIYSLPNKKYYFEHPIIGGYLAGSTTNQQTRNTIYNQPPCNMKAIACNYMARHKTVGDEIRRLLSTTDDLLKSDQLTAGQWLKYLPRDLPERKMILQQLTNDLQNESLTMMLRTRILSALAASGDPGVPTLFRHLLNSPHSNVRQLAVLGCGYLGDLKSVGDLIALLGDIPNVAQAACMALVNIGTKTALEAVAKVLIQGDEQIRRAAAESFANHPQEGFPILKDGSSVEDLLTRRAVIYGLRRVQQPWATEILEELQIEDEQWVVKDAAAQAVVQLNTPDPAIPQSQPPLEDLPWLVAFASDRDLGISSGAPARDMLKLALNEGTDDEKLAALGQVRLRGEFEVFPAIYDILYGNNPELQEAAYHTIWHIASSGYEIPPPIKFGFG
jgi:HEAT repeat protein